MKKIIISIVWMSILFMPCLLTFCEGGYSLLSFIGIDNGPYLVNLIGILYSLFLLKFHRWLVPDWMRNTVDNLVREDRMPDLDWFFLNGGGCRFPHTGAMENRWGSFCGCGSSLTGFDSPALSTFFKPWHWQFVMNSRWCFIVWHQSILYWQ